MDIHSPPGLFDILPAAQLPWQDSNLWNFLESLIRQISFEYGYTEIRTPIFEKTELFQRGVGENSDIVSKEMYTFNDRSDRSLTLRPEGTAPVVRAFIEHHLDQKSMLHKLFYLGPMFRYERSQAGRYRQHHQFGVEVMGISAPEQDAELIDLAYSLYSRLGIKNLNVVINSIGTDADRDAYRKALKTYLKTHYDQLSPESQKRFDVNPLRILDSKQAIDQEIIKNAPSILNFLGQEAFSFFGKVRACLDNLNIPYQVDPHLVRGLDYYNHTVFEITSGELGAQNSLGGGGRYDGLIKSLGGPDIPSTGFATGLERVLQIMLAQNVPLPNPCKPTLFMISIGEEAKQAVFKIVHKLREEGVSVIMDLSGRKLAKVMQSANQMGVKYVAIIGDNELASQQVDLKEMQTGEILKAPLYRLGKVLRIDRQSGQFLKLLQEMEKPFEDELEAEFFLKKLNQNIKQTQELTEELQKAMREMQGYLEESSS